MTSPTPPPEPPEPDQAPTAESAPVQDPATPVAAEPATGPQPGMAGPAPHQHLPHQPGPHPSYLPPYAYQPFVPKLREPWLNPAKRGALAAVAIVAAVVLLGGGFLIGAAVGSHRDRGSHVVPMMPTGRIGYGMPDSRPGYQYHHYGPAGLPGRLVPGVRVVPGGRVVPPPAPSSSASSSSSHR